MLDYSAWIAFVSVIGGLSGVAFAIWYINKFKKQSIIVVSLVIIMFVSTAAVPAFGVPNLYATVAKG